MLKHLNYQRLSIVGSSMLVHQNTYNLATQLDPLYQYRVIIKLYQYELYQYRVIRALPIQVYILDIKMDSLLLRGGCMAAAVTLLGCSLLASLSSGLNIPTEVETDRQ